MGHTQVDVCVIILVESNRVVYAFVVKDNFNFFQRSFLIIGPIFAHIGNHSWSDVSYLLESINKEFFLLISLK